MISSLKAELTTLYILFTRMKTFRPEVNTIKTSYKLLSLFICNQMRNLILLSFIWCSRVLFLSSFTVVVELSKSMTCLHFHSFIYSKLILCNKSKNTGVTLNNSLGKTIISSQRLGTTSASLTLTESFSPLRSVLHNLPC